MKDVYEKATLLTKKEQRVIKALSRSHLDTVKSNL